MRRLILIVASLGIFWTAGDVPAQVQPQLRPDAVRMAVIGDMGTGGTPQYEVARQMARARERFPFDFVITVGDNIYGSSRPVDFEKKFAAPYKPLLDAGVKFYASLGNHDDPVKERSYQPFNMNGESYYTFKKGNVRFFALDSNYMDPRQLAWLESELKKSSDDEWKIMFFHHPLYSSGDTHGSSTDLRLLLEPLFTKYKVNVVFAGHEHFYERIKPQNGIYHFIEGASGQLRRGDINRTALTAKGFDTDNSFMLVEFAENQMNFYAISRTGEVVDSGVIFRQGTPTIEAAPAVTSSRPQPIPNPSAPAGRPNLPAQ